MNMLLYQVLAYTIHEKILKVHTKTKRLKYVSTWHKKFLIT